MSAIEFVAGTYSIVAFLVLAGPTLSMAFGRRGS